MSLPQFTDEEVRTLRAMITAYEMMLLRRKLFTSIRGWLVAGFVALSAVATLMAAAVTLADHWP